MRLLLEIGYVKLLLQEFADVGVILRALAEATPVEEADGKTNWSDPAKYVPKKKVTLDVPKFICNEQLIDEEKATEMSIEALKEQNATLSKERREAKEKLSALEKKVKSLTGQEKKPLSPPQEKRDD